MKRILFVDDEPHVLHALENVLRKERLRWDITFALSGAEAMTEMEKAPFDVVISDMRMPGMDGAQLLARVKQEYPSAERIILSGHAERVAVLKTVPVAHQFLSKPCDTTVLRKVIERACNLQDLFQNEALRRLIGGMETLPSPPHTYMEVMRAMEQPACSVDRIARIIEQDTAMCLKVLQLVNSAYFGLSRQIVSVDQAIAYLGMDLVKVLILSTHIFSTSVATGSPRALHQSGQHGALIARVAKRMLTGSEALIGFTAGILHDVGRLVLSQAWPGRFAEVTKTAHDTTCSLFDAEKQIFGVTHAQVGAYLLGTWGLPPALVETVAFHHNPDAAGHDRFDALGAVHVADALIESSLEPDNFAPFDQNYIEKMQVAYELPRWRAIVQEEIHGTLQ